MIAATLLTAEMSTVDHVVSAQTNFEKHPLFNVAARLKTSEAVLPPSSA